MRSIRIAGSGPKLSATVLTMAAPVGVVNSACTVDGARGMPCSSSAVAGAGMLTRPWAISTKPPPVGTGEQTSRSRPSKSSPIALPTTSAIESTAPTSWKWTFSIVVPWTLASASPSRVKMRLARSFCGVRQAAGVDHVRDVVQMAVFMFGLVDHVHLERPEALSS